MGTCYLVCFYGVGWFWDLTSDFAGFLGGISLEWPAEMTSLSGCQVTKSAFQGTYASSASKIFRHSGITLVFKTTFEVFTRVGPDNSLERLTERSVGLVTDRPSNVYELFVTLLSNCIAFCIRHSVTYSSGVCPSSSLKRAANAERDMPAASARDSTVQGVFTLS